MNKDGVVRQVLVLTSEPWESDNEAWGEGRSLRGLAQAAGGLAEQLI